MSKEKEFSKIMKSLNKCESDLKQKMEKVQEQNFQAANSLINIDIETLLLFDKAKRNLEGKI